MADFLSHFTLIELSVISLLYVTVNILYVTVDLLYVTLSQLTYFMSQLQGDEIPLNRIETAPARLEKTDCDGPEGGEDHVKTVSFFLGDEPERKVQDQFFLSF